MIVDDTPANLHLLVKLLVENGHRVMAFTGGEQALNAAAKSPPDLVLLDICMPGMDGFEVCRRFKADQKLQDIPVLFVSVIRQSDQVVKAFAAGAADYVSKPFQAEETLARVNTHLRLARLLRNNISKKQAIEKKVRQRTRELELKNVILVQSVHRLEQLNAALDVLARKVCTEGKGVFRKDMEDIFEDISALLRKLEHSQAPEQQEILDRIRSRVSAARSMLDPSDDQLKTGLTIREYEVALHILDGRKGPDIASILGISLRSVHSHGYKIRKKLGLRRKDSLKDSLKNWLIRELPAQPQPEGAIPGLESRDQGERHE